MDAIVEKDKETEKDFNKSGWVNWHTLVPIPYHDELIKIQDERHKILRESINKKDFLGELQLSSDPYITGNNEFNPEVRTNFIITRILLHPVKFLSKEDNLSLLHKIAALCANTFSDFLSVTNDDESKFRNGNEIHFHNSITSLRLTGGLIGEPNSHIPQGMLFEFKIKKPHE